MDREQIGPYRVLSTAAVDRLTITHRARRSPREPTVLIKTIKPGVTATPPVARALEREADRLRTFRHPLWPTLIETIEDDGGFALVLVDHGGHRLDVLLERSRRVEPLAAVAIAIEVARAAAAIHHAGGAHGALQPELVELTARGGICLHPHLTAADLPGELTLPINMAPEQVVGDPSDAKSDVFLLGALLYRMLTGQAPFEGDEEGISQRIRHHPPTPIRALAREVPSPIAKVVMRCLAKRRHDRIPDMVSLAARLTRVLRAETSLPSEQLVTRALSRAGLAEPLPAPLDRDAERGIMTPRAMLRRHGLTLALASAIALAAVVSWRSLRDDASDSRSTPRGVLDSPAHLRVLARPWAEVYIDNKLVDTTPIGFPIPVAPGRHIVVLRHPAAPDEARTVDLIAGQTMLIDVDMNVRRPAASAAPAPSATAD